MIGFAGFPQHSITRKIWEPKSVTNGEHGWMQSFFKATTRPYPASKLATASVYRLAGDLQFLPLAA
jgi:hypothetical protein